MAKNVKNSSKKSKKKVRPKKWIWKKHIPALSILFLLGFALYFQSIYFEYVLDDKIVLTENDYVKEKWAGIPKILSSDSFEGYFKEQKDLLQGARYRPFSIAAFAVEYGIVGEANPMVSHLINIVLYGFLACLIYFLMFRLNISWPHKSWYFSLPFIVALLYVLHPLHIEAVANVKGRDELLTFIFSIISFLCIYRYSYQRQLSFLILGSVSFFAALMFKENALPFLAVIPASLWVFRKKDLNFLVLPFVALLIPTIIYFIIRLQVIGYLIDPPGKKITDLLNNPFAEMNSGERLATIFYTLLEYLKLQVFPHPLTHDYYPYHIPKMTWSNAVVYLSFLINAILFALSLWGIFKRKAWGFFLFFYFASVSIVSNILISVGVFMNERFVFIASLGFCFLIPWVVQKGAERFSFDSKIILGSFVAGLSILFVLKDLDRIPDWKNPFTLNESAIKVSKNSARANCFYGVELYKKAQNETDNSVKQDLLKEAAGYVDRAIEIYPEYGSALKMKAGILGAQYTGIQDREKTLDQFFEIMQDKHIPYVHQFIMDYLSKNPDNIDAILQFYHRLGFETYYSKLNNSKLALVSLENALRLDPESPFILRDLAIIYHRVGNSKSKAMATKALAYYPNDQALIKILQ